MDPTYRQLSTCLLQFPPKSENIKSATKLNGTSFETAESIISTLEDLSSNVLNAQIREDNIDTIRELALTLQKVFTTLQASTESISAECNELSSKLRNIKQNGSRATLGTFKAKLKFTWHRAQESKKINHFNDSSETLYEDRDADGGFEKLPYSEIIDGAALSNLLVDMGRFWTPISVDICQLIEWLDLRCINGVNQHLPEMYARSTLFPRGKAESILAALHHYLETPRKL